ncbi:MAG: helix-hairpin-helix domain-containing protein [Nanoarchaeota archaeon]
MKIFFVFALLIFLANFISASCNDGQININSASLTELDAISGIGPVKAQAIIDSRPFENIDELIDVNGIGEITLQNIKTQGLACVGDYEEKKKEEKNETVQIQANVTVEINEEKTEEIPEQTNAEPQIIRLNGEVSKDIKSDSNFENLYKNKILWLVIFGLFVGILLSIKKYKEYRNEF